MNLNKYPVIANASHSGYEFLSEGPNGTIRKIVLYQKMGNNVFNLAFGDWDEIRQAISDSVRTNNEDRDKVMATVALTVIDFIEYHPNASVFAQGSTPSRTRLYQMGISANLKEIGQSFQVEGFIDDCWELFRERKNYQAFLLKAK